MAKKEERKEQEEKIGEALMKVALGYQIAEVTEEYAEVDGALRLTKRKKTKKDVPPDLKAVQLLLDSSGGAEYGAMTDEELEAEKARLLAALQQAQGGEVVKAEKVEKVERLEKVVKAKAVKGNEGKKARPKPRKRVVRKKG